MNTSTSLDPTVRNLTGCGCCDGITVEAPLEIWNRAGLTALAARIGTHSRFKASLLSRLSSRDFPRLQALRTRDDEDFAIAFLDAWAVLADVLTFYQERIANESYLRTALERRSLRELARLIGYELRPGVAASAPLAFALEDAAGATAVTLIAIGTRVQSLPGPGQTPQTFETIEAISARPEWNAIKPRLAQPQPLAMTMKSVLLQGLASNLTPGDTVMIVAGNGASDRIVKRVRSSSTNAAAGTTTMLVEDDPPDPPPFFFIALPASTFSLAPLKLTTTHVLQTVKQKTWSHSNLLAQVKMHKWALPALKTNLFFQIAKFLLPVEFGVFIFRQKAAVFGHNAPKWRSLPAIQRLGDSSATPPIDPVYDTNWDSPAITLDDEDGGAGFIHLDTIYSRIVEGGYAVIETPERRAILHITEVDEVSRADFTLSARVTRLKITKLSGDALSLFPIRETTVFVESEKLPLAQLPIIDPVSSAPVSLDGPYPELAVGQRVVITGEAVDLDDVTTSEALTIAEANLVDGFTWLTFKEGPANSYVRAKVSFNANVALATHGEQVQEALGSGDSTQPFQKFALRQPPLTHVSAKTPAGAASTLEVRVNDLLWREVPSFFRAGPEERVYTVRATEEGGTIVQFGDGKNGARVPTGQENIRAQYRKGMGAAGLVSAGQLTLLQSRPLGVRSVVNPVAAAGMADRETLDEARGNAPLMVLTLDRIVSLRDYGDFARAFSGVAKAQATLAWSGAGRRVFVTVAGPDGAAIEETGGLYANLLGAMRAAGDPQVPLRVKTFAPAFFTLVGTIFCAPDHLEAKIFAEVEKALRDAFSFSAREFSQAVARSEVVAAIHSVPGVVAVDLDVFHRVDKPATLETALTAAPPRTGATDDLGAELMLLDARPLALTVIRASA